MSHSSHLRPVLLVGISIALLAPPCWAKGHGLLYRRTTAGALARLNPQYSMFSSHRAIQVQQPLQVGGAELPAGTEVWMARLKTPQGNRRVAIIKKPGWSANTRAVVDSKALGQAAHAKARALHTGISEVLLGAAPHGSRPFFHPEQPAPVGGNIVVKRDFAYQLPKLFGLPSLKRGEGGLAEDTVRLPTGVRQRATKALNGMLAANQSILAAGGMHTGFQPRPGRRTVHRSFWSDSVNGTTVRTEVSTDRGRDRRVHQDHSTTMISPDLRHIAVLREFEVGRGRGRFKQLLRRLGYKVRRGDTVALRLGRDASGGQSLSVWAKGHENHVYRVTPQADGVDFVRVR